MRAYAILDGGGVKGAALAGCLQAAEELHIEFAGYAGTSAGSIVALLAALGYTGQDLLRMMVEEVDFTAFLDDGGTRLLQLRQTLRGLRPGRSWRFGLRLLAALWRERRSLRRLHQRLGLYTGRRLQEFLRDKLAARLPEPGEAAGATFADLRRWGFPPLKVVAADVGMGRPVVFSAAGAPERDVPVLEAVRASAGYPFVFEPVLVHGRPLVDGGLGSSLPVFAFERERQQDGLPVIAFDLVSAPRPAPPPDYDLLDYCRDMLDTALESGDSFMRQVTRGLYHVRVPIPADVGALDFGLSKERRRELWRCGHSQTHAFFRKAVPHWLEARDEVERLQARYGDPKLVRHVLAVVVQEIEQNTPARGVRAQIMLPTGRGTRQVVYEYGMDGDPDADLELALDGGCSGRAWTSRRPQLADLVEAKRDPRAWRLTAPQQSKVRPDRQAMLCVPIFDLNARGGERAAELPVLGTLSLDSATPLSETRWLTDGFAMERARFWADVFAKLLA